MSIALTVLYNSGLPMPPRAAVEGAIVFLPLLGLVMSSQRMIGRLVPSSALVISVGFLIVVALSAIMNGGAGTSMLVLLAPALLAVSFAVSGGLLDEADYRTLARWVVILALLQFVIAVAEVHFLAPWAQEVAATNGQAYRFRPNLILEGVGRASGTMGHPIVFGLICAIAALFTLNRDVVASRVGGLLLFLPLAYAVVLSGSRSSVAALLVGTLVYFLHPRTPTKRVFRVLIVLVLVPTMMIYIVEAIAGARVVSLYSLTNRLEALPRFAETFNRPIPQMLIGQGEAFTLGTVADNQFLTTSGLYGLIGLVLFALAVIYALFSTRPIVTANVAVLAFMSLSFDVLEWSFSALMLWLLVGMSHGGIRRYQTPDSIGNPTSAHIRRTPSLAGSKG